MSKMRVWKLGKPEQVVEIEDDEADGGCPYCAVGAGSFSDEGQVIFLESERAVRRLECVVWVEALDRPIIGCRKVTLEEAVKEMRDAAEDGADLDMELLRELEARLADELKQV